MVNIVLYQHRKLDTNEIFYIGIGNIKRPYNKRMRSKFWNRIVNKHGYVIEIIHTNLSWKEACELEKEYISLYGRLDLKNGILCNMTNGGEGANGVIVSKETKDKLSKIRKGRKQSKEWIKNRANSLRGNKLTIEHKDKLRKIKLGTTLTEEHKQNISTALRNSKNPPGAKKVINMKTKKIYKSAIAASLDSEFSYSAFRAKLSGQNKNNTNFKYLSNGNS